MTMISTTTPATIPTIGINVKGRRQRRLIINIITLFVSFVLLLAGVGLSFTSSSSPLSPFAFGKEEGKIKGLLGADDAGFLNPDEEESTKVSDEDELEVHGKNEEEEEEEEEEENLSLIHI